MKRFSTYILLAAIFVGSAAVPLSASTQSGETRKQIESRLEQRYSELLKAEDQGKIGETWQGFVEATDAKAAADSSVKKLVEAENADRTKLYETIASDESKREKVSATMVGERNALRKLQKAEPNHFLKAKNGQWVQLKDLDRLRKDGRIGETWDGYLSAVNGKDDAKVSAVLDIENHLRRDQYQKDARKQNKSVNEVAEAAGARNLEKVSAGEWFLPKGGQWQKKG